MTVHRQFSRFALLAALTAAAAACGSTPPAPVGAAAAGSLGASAVLPEDEPGVTDSPAPVDPWLDDARVLARVNGRLVTLRQVRHLMGSAYDSFLDRRDELERIVQARVRDLVLKQLVVEEATRMGIDVGEEQFQRAVRWHERYAAERGTTLEQTIRDQGMTRREWDARTKEDILHQVALDLFIGRYARSSIGKGFKPGVDTDVRPSEVLEFGRRNPEVARVEEEAVLRVIDLRRAEFFADGVTPSEVEDRLQRALDEARERLRGGEAFADVARDLSHGPQAAQGGLWEPFGPDASLRREYKDWAFREGRKTGDVSEPIVLPTGRLLLFMERLTRAHDAPIEEWAPEVRAHLKATKESLAAIDVQIRLLEDASVTPATVKERLLAEMESARELHRKRLRTVAP